MSSRKRKCILDLSKRHLRRLIQSNTQNEASYLELENESGSCSSVCINEINSSEYNYSSNYSHDKDMNTFSESPNSINEDLGNSVLEAADVALGMPQTDHNNDVESQSDNECENDPYNGLVNHDESDLSVVEHGSTALNQQFQLQLRQWATKHKVKRTAVSDLLSILRTHYTEANIPKDSRTLLKTPRSTEIKSITPGQYYHFNLTSTLLSVVEADIKEYQFNEISIKVGIDGLPISDSNISQLWPILGCIYPTSRIFLIGVYHGYSKPADSNEFLKYFVDDISILIEQGLVYNDVKFNISIRCIVADAPAKSFITKTKGHTGYFSCSKCEQEGTFIDGRMAFPLTNSKESTKESFITQENVEYHLGTSILTNIPGFDIVSDIPLDYMHLVCIGVVKKMISLWIKGPLQIRLSTAQVEIISKRLIQMKPFIVREFARKQELHCYSNWKATELRQFLLYTGPVVLYQVPPYTLYNHFLTLHVAIRIFCDENHDSSLQQYAHDLILHFVRSFTVIYGDKFVSHNVHGLIHLKNDVKRFGHLDAFSAFPFENFMKYIKTFISKPEKPLQQIHRRYMEILQLSGGSNCKEDKEEHKINHMDGPLIPNMSFGQQLRTMQISNWYFSVKKPDNCCHIGTTVIEIHNIAFCNESGQTVIIGKQFLTVTDFYHKPCPSSNNSCFFVDDLSEVFEMWPVNQISGKCLRLPHASGFAVFPLLHK